MRRCCANYIAEVHRTFAFVVDPVPMFAMTGEVRPSAGDPTLARLVVRLRGFESIRMSETESMVLVPPIGSLLVERLGAGELRFEIAAESPDALGVLALSITDAITSSVPHPPSVAWASAVEVPVSFS